MLYKRDKLKYFEKEIRIVELEKEIKELSKKIENKKNKDLILERDALIDFKTQLEEDVNMNIPQQDLDEIMNLGDEMLVFLHFTKNNKKAIIDEKSEYNKNRKSWKIEIDFNDDSIFLED